MNNTLYINNFEKTDTEFQLKLLKHNENVQPEDYLHYPLQLPVNRL